ncbi:HAD family hydrolase [Cytobacillus sp. FJAT-54145]|uniref:HAD family hydrolase n=1 Tax=Cytobacillus spartinae TaxID=3299023 RepID=A0ABW6K8Q0_9BACI
MSKYKVILFDLDGTLTDPKVGITKSVQYALGKMGISVTTLDQLDSFIGPPLKDSFSELYHFNSEEVEQAIQLYRERFVEHGMYENEVYESIPELLHSLKGQGKSLVIATSKPTVFAEKILQYFKLDSYFDLIVGSNLDGTRSAKTDIIQYILDVKKDCTLEDFIMIGDRKHDIIGANNTGIDSIGVTYGYGSHSELMDSEPTYIVHTVKEIGELLLERCEITSANQHQKF